MQPGRHRYGDGTGIAAGCRHAGCSIRPLGRGSRPTRRRRGVVTTQQALFDKRLAPSRRLHRCWSARPRWSTVAGDARPRWSRWSTKSRSDRAEARMTQFILRHAVGQRRRLRRHLTRQSRRHRQQHGTVVYTAFVRHGRPTGLQLCAQRGGDRGARRRRQSPLRRVHRHRQRRRRWAGHPDLHDQPLTGADDPLWRRSATARSPRSTRARDDQPGLTGTLPPTTSTATSRPTASRAAPTMYDGMALGHRVTDRSPSTRPPAPTVHARTPPR